MDVLVISTCIAILSVQLLPQEFFVEQMSDAVSRRGQPVDIDSPPEVVARWGRYLGMLTALATHPLFALALAGVLSLVFTVLAGGRATFRDHLAASSHAFLVPALGMLLVLPLQRLTGDPDAWFTPALLLRPSDSLAFHLAEGIDLFSLWMLGLAGYWAGSLNPKVGGARGAVILIVLYLALDLATVLLTR